LDFFSNINYKKKLDERNDSRVAAFGAHLRGGEVGVTAGPVPVTYTRAINGYFFFLFFLLVANRSPIKLNGKTLHRLRVECDDHPELLGHAVEQVAGHPELVAHLDAFTGAHLELPLAGHHLGFVIIL
jgi:hypothetical protein